MFFSLTLFAFSVVFSVTAVEAALFLALITLIYKKTQEKTLADIWPALRSHQLFIPWMAYLGVCLLTSLTAYYPVKGLGQLNSDFLKYLCFSTLLFTVKKEHLPRLSAVYISAAVLAAFAGFFEVIRSIAAHGPGLARANGFMNAVRYAEVLTIAFALLLSRALLPEAETFRRENLFYKLAGAAVFTAVVFSQTRSAYLGLLIVMLTMFVFVKKTRFKLLALSGLMLAGGLAAAALVPAVKDRVEAMVKYNRSDYSANSASTGINVRIELWKLGYKMFKAHPVVGVGPDNIKKVFKKYHPDPFPEEGIYGTLNNLYIHQAAERGTLGLAALALLFGAMFIFALKGYRASGSPYALWALCALPAFYVMNITEISFQHVHTSFAIFLALAFSAAAEQEKKLNG